MKSMLAAAAIIGLLSVRAPPAHADYAWRFNPTHVSAENPSGNGFTWIPDSSVSSSRAASWLPRFNLSITDAAFASHTLSVAWSQCDTSLGGCAIPLHGDISAIVDFTGVEGPSPYVYGSGEINLAWTTTGALTGDIFLAGMLTDLTMTSLDDGRWQGRFLSDNSECGMTTQSCFMTGNWQFLGAQSASVAEPATLALFGVGILGLALIRRRAAFA
jgi:hypothetical protein